MVESVISGLAVAAVVGVSGWVYSIGNRATKLEEDNKGMRELVAAKHEALKELTTSRFNDVDKRLERIEKAMNGALRHG